MMFFKIKALIAAAALSGSISANIQAEPIDIEKVDFVWALSPGMAESAERLADWDSFSVIAGFVHPGVNLLINSNKAITVNQEDLPELSEAVLKQAIARNEAASAVIETSPALAKAQAEPEAAKAGSAKVEAEMKEAASGPAQAEVEPEAKPSPAPAQGDTEPTPEAGTDMQTEAEAEVAETGESQAPANPETAPEPAPEVEPAAADDATVKEITVKATAYTAYCEGCSGITRTGIDIRSNPNQKVIAVDPSVIPLGSKVYVEGYGEAIAGDTGGAIKGNRIDVFIPSKQDAINFGVKQLKVKILD